MKLNYVIRALAFLIWIGGGILCGGLSMVFASRTRSSTAVIAFLSKHMTTETATLISAITCALCVAAIVWWVLGLTPLSKLAFLGIADTTTKVSKVK